MAKLDFARIPLPKRLIADYQAAAGSAVKPADATPVQPPAAKSDKGAALRQ